VLQCLFFSFFSGGPGIGSIDFVIGMDGTVDAIITGGKVGAGICNLGVGLGNLRYPYHLHYRCKELDDKHVGLACR
jgi:hypothetical protein